MTTDNTTAPLSPEREQEIRETHPGEWYAGPWTQGDVDPGDGFDAYTRVVHQESGQVLATLPDWAGPIALFIADAHDAVPELLHEIDRLRKQLDEAQLHKAALEAKAELLDHLERHTLPQLRREIEHHQDGKKRWRDRAEKAESRVTELERPALEAKRNEMRDVLNTAMAEAREDRDYESEADIHLKLRDYEEQWKRQDAATAAPR